MRLTNTSHTAVFQALSLPFDNPPLDMLSGQQSGVRLCWGMGGSFDKSRVLQERSQSAQLRADQPALRTNSPTDQRRMLEPYYHNILIFVVVFPSCLNYGCVHDEARPEQSRLRRQLDPMKAQAMAPLTEVGAKLSAVTSRAVLAATAAAAVLAAALMPAQATPVITNGSFETVTTASSTEFGTRYGGQVVTGWTTGGYNFLFKPGTADTTGAPNEYGTALKLWGPGNGSANGLTASSPAGGNFIGADGAFGQAAIQQIITGLDVNSVASITFYWAGAQQYNFNGPSTEAWQVTLGNETHSTQVVNNAEHGFTGWQKATLSFVVTSSTEVLSFLALGTPAGVPPFSLLDGVSISEVPEPTSLALVGAGLEAAGLLSRRRRMKA